ncbi:hypothetical protein BC829DRAFT_300540 [Chytridium lagenaria]|nr:hypothetical protein BC829DRAFT_300540 [Chytridium lagenaria]
MTMVSAATAADQSSCCYLQHQQQQLNNLSKQQHQSQQQPRAPSPLPSLYPALFLAYRDVFFCPCCQNLLFLPITLPCGNAVCSSCLPSSHAIQPSSTPSTPLSPSSSRHATGRGHPSSDHSLSSHPPTPPLSATSTTSTSISCGALSDDSDAACRPPPSYACPVPSCRMVNKRHKDREDMVDVTLKRIMELCFPAEMEALALVSSGLKRMEAIRREHLRKQHDSYSSVNLGGDMQVDAVPCPSILVSPPILSFRIDDQDHFSAPPQHTPDSIPLIIQDCFTKAVELAPCISKSYVARAQAYLTLGYVRSARNDAHVAASLRPESSVVKELMKRVDDMERCTGMDCSTDVPHAAVPEPRQIQQSTVISACAQSLECTLCFSMLGDPVTAPCGHSWCRCCLLTSLSHANACPLCRRTLPNYIYFERRPRNLILSRLIDYVQQCIKSLGTAPPMTMAPSISSSESLGCIDMMMPTVTSASTNAALAATKTLIVPIFVGPLVLPGVPCFMHIFEPRYRGMVHRLIAEGQRTFGLCLPEPETEEGKSALGVNRGGGASSASSSRAFMSYTMDAAERDDAMEVDEGGCRDGGFPTFPSSATVGVCTGGSCQRYMPVGTLLQIRSCEPVYDEAAGGEELPRFMIDAIGVSRFRVLERGISDGGYNVALVERLEDVELDDEETDGKERDEEGLPTSPDLDSFSSMNLATADMEKRSASHPGTSAMSPSLRGSKVEDKIVTVVESASAVEVKSPQEGVIVNDSQGSWFDFDCPVTNFFNTNFRCPLRPSIRSCASGSGDGSSPTTAAGVLKSGQSSPSSQPTSPSLFSSSFLCSKNVARSFCSAKDRGANFSFASLLPTCGSSSSTSLPAVPTSVNQLISSPLPSETSPHPHRRIHRGDPYSRLSTLRCRLLGILSSLPPQARLHLKLLNGPAPTDAAMLSFWIANIAPVGDYRKYEILKSVDVTNRVEKVVEMFGEDG